MPKCFPIDFVRQAFEQKMLEEHLKNEEYFGGKKQVNIFSFYEQLKANDEIDRYIENYDDLVDQQNRTGLILNGVIQAPENPSITNLYSCTIIPLSWVCGLRCTTLNRDQAIETVDNLIKQLKGRKVDIAELKCRDKDNHIYFTPFVVGTIGQYDQKPTLKNGDFLGAITNKNQIPTIISSLSSQGITNNFDEDSWVYVEHEGKIKVAKLVPSVPTWIFVEDDGTYPQIIFPPEHESFEKYKLSLSFDAIRCDEPHNLNGVEFMHLTFGGSATLVSESVKLGNDLIKVSATKLKIKAQTTIDFTVLQNNPTWWLEPLEMPSGNEANTNPIQLASNVFKTNSHTDALTLSLQYTFIFDTSNTLLKQLFYYGRYGIQGLTINDISPNMIFNIVEIWSSWGNIEQMSFKAKIVESIDIENTESDTLTLSMSLQIQGDND